MFLNTGRESVNGTATKHGCLILMVITKNNDIWAKTNVELRKRDIYCLIFNSMVFTTGILSDLRGKGGSRLLGGGSELCRTMSVCF